MKNFKLIKLYAPIKQIKFSCLTNLKTIAQNSIIGIIYTALVITPLIVSAAEDNKPEQVINDVADRFIEALKKEKITQENGKEQIKKIVDDILSPVIDFRRIAYRTMGKNYKKATTKQFLEFEEAIKKSLINTYANPLLEDSRQLAEKVSVEIRDVKPGKSKSPTSIVSTWLKIDATEKYDIVYYMYLKKSNNKWLVENIAVEGINMSISFRNQFERLIGEYNGDIDQVTKVWAESKVNE